MAQCITTPTATQFTTITTDSVSTSFSESITTLPAQTSTITTTICATSTVNGTAPATSCAPTTILSTIPGGTSTTSIAVPVTLPLTTTSPTATLFGTSCGPTLPPTDSGSSTSSSSTPPPTPTPTPPPSASLSLSSGTSTYNTSSTLPNGSVTVIQQTSTYVVTAIATPQGNSGGSGSKTNVGAIAGGAAGGVGLLVIIALALVYCFRRKSRFDDIGLNDDEMDNISPFPVRHQKHPRGPLDEDIGEDPKPNYHYGALSQQASSAEHAGGAGSVGLSPWDPGYTTMPGTNYGGGPESSNGHGYQSASSAGYAGGSSAYGNMSATGPAAANNIPPSPNNFAANNYPPTAYPVVPAAIPVPSSTRSESTRSGTLDTSFNHAAYANSGRPLTVANPDAGSVHAIADTKDPQVYLRADTGYTTQPGASSSTPSTRPVVQHRDAGAVDSAVASGSTGTPASAGAPGPGPVRRRRSTDKHQMEQGAPHPGDHDEPAPPAYEA